jgi:hypothetical protein
MRCHILGERSRRASFFGLLLLAGCAKPTLSPVSGRVTLDDQPLPNATVLFQPESTAGRPGAGSSGKTNDKGEFTLKQIGTDIAGAVPGKHQVTVSALDGPPPAPTEDRPKPRKEKVPAQYRNKPLTFDVPPEGTTSANFPLKSK